MGLLGADSAGTFRWQIYGSGSAYGFLDSTWGNWDILKNVNDQMDIRVSGSLVRVLNAGNYQNYALPLSGGTMTGSRPITIDPSGGGIYIKGDTGGWGLGYYFYGSSGTFRGGFGALGGGDSLTNFWVGPAYNNTWMTFSSSANNSQVALQQGGNQVLHAGNYTSYAPPYGSTGSRNVWTITDWNQATYPNAHFLSSESSTTNAPSSDYIYGLQTSFHRSGAAYRTQMVTELYSSPASIWVRNSRDSDVWTSWAKLIHSLNYTNYAVGVANNSSLNTDSRNTRGVTRLYRRDDNSDYSVQTYWTGSYWRLYGYSGDSGHADTYVGYADNAGSSASCTGSAAQLNGQAASYYENRDTTGVSISSGTLTLTRGAGNLDRKSTRLNSSH